MTKEIAIAILGSGLLGAICGGFIKGCFDTFNQNENRVIQTTEKERQRIIESGDKIIKHLESLSITKNTRDKTILDIISAGLNGKIGYLDSILHNLKNELEKKTTSDDSSPLQKTKRSDSSKKKGGFDLFLSASESDLSHYTDFYRPQVFILLKPLNEKRIKAIEVDWDDGSGLMSVDFEYSMPGKYYVAEHYYLPEKENKRELEIKVTFEDDTKESKKTTIFTYI